MDQGKLTTSVDDDWESGDEIDVRYYWNIINRRKWSIIGLALAAGLLTTLVVFGMTPIYRASTTVLLESQATNVVSIKEVYGVDTSSLDYLATQTEIMRGRSIAETVVDSLGLIKQPEPRPEHQPLIDLDWRSWLPFGMQKNASRSQPDERERAVDSYLDSLNIEPVRNTQLVRVQFDSADPKLAARVADAHARAYIDSMLESRADATKSATEWMADGSRACGRTYWRRRPTCRRIGNRSKSSTWRDSRHCLPRRSATFLPGLWKRDKRVRRRRLPTCR